MRTRCRLESIGPIDLQRTRRNSSLPKTRALTGNLLSRFPGKQTRCFPPVCRFTYRHLYTHHQQRSPKTKLDGRVDFYLTRSNETTLRRPSTRPSSTLLDPPAPGGSAADRLRAPLHGPSRHLVGRDAGLGVSGGTRVGGTGGDVRARRGSKTAFLLLHRSF